MIPIAARRLLSGAQRWFTEGRLKAVGAVAFLVAFSMWAVASPVGASPDENFHIASIWCSHGIQAGVCESGPTAATRVVPSQFPLDIVECYAGHPDVSAACVPNNPSGLAATDRGNFAGLYPPVFYWFDGFFVGGDVNSSVIAMRLANGILFVALFAAIYLLSTPGLRRPMVAGSLVTVVPLGMFFIPSVNPTSWALLSAATFLTSLLGYLSTEDRRRRLALGGLAALGLLAGAGARSDAAMYVVVAIGAAVILTVRLGRDSLRRLVYPAVLVILAGLAFVTAGQSAVASPGAGEAPSLSLGRLITTALDVPALWIGGSGAKLSDIPWGLGWLDTAMPGVVWVGAWTVFAGVVFLALAGAGWRRGLATGLVGLAALMIPTYVLYLQDLKVGDFVQPRYVLPLLTVVVVAAMSRLDGAAFRLTRGQRWTVVAVLAVANAVALHTNLRRYVTGVDVVSWNLDSKIEWWWSTPFSPNLVWALGTLAFAAGAILLTKELVVETPATGESSVPVPVPAPVPAP